MEPPSRIMPFSTMRSRIMIRRLEKLMRGRREREEERRNSESALIREENFTRISTDNIIEPPASGRLTRHRSAASTASMETSHGSRGSQSGGRSDGLLPRRYRPNVSTSNIVDSPDAPRMTRRGSREYVSAMRTASTRQERRFDPIARSQRRIVLEPRKPRKRVRFAVSLTPQEARDLLEKGRRMSGEEASARTAPSNEQSPANRAIVLIESTTPAPPPQQDEASNMEAESPRSTETALDQSLNTRDLVIQRPADRAGADRTLIALMVPIASGHASQDQKREFAAHVERARESLNVSREVGTSGQGATEGRSPARGIIWRHINPDTGEEEDIPEDSADEEDIPFVSDDSSDAASDSSSEPESDTSDKENVDPAPTHAPQTDEGSNRFRIYEDSETRTPQPRRPLQSLPIPRLPTPTQPPPPVEDNSSFSRHTIRRPRTESAENAPRAITRRPAFLRSNLSREQPRHSNALTTTRVSPPLPTLAPAPRTPPPNNSQRLSYPLTRRPPLEGSGVAFPLQETPERPRLELQPATDDEGSSPD
ncbi:MAG: hypothetical protein LQ338_007134 [Usnochroma carphineum]|nr:MAG: hypothetical protein LQ338_007134 [Usnochroma carphineum]